MKYILIFLFFSNFILLYSTSLDNYIYNFDYYNQIKPEKENIFNNFSKLIYHNHNGNINYLRQVKNSEIVLSEKESRIFEILINSKTYEYLNPLNQFEILLKEYPKSAIIRAMIVEFAYLKWLYSGDPIIANYIFSLLDELNIIIGSNPFTLYYEALIRFTSSSYYDEEKIYNNLIYSFYNFESNQRLHDLLISFMNQTNNYKYLEDIYKSYSHFENKSVYSMIYFLNGFYLKNEVNKSLIIANYILENYTLYYPRAKSYHILAIYENNLENKINYYRNSLRSIENPISNLKRCNINNNLRFIFPVRQDYSQIIYELATIYYKLDPKLNLNLARHLLNRAEAIYPNNEEINLLLWKLRLKVMGRIIVYYFLPIFILLTSSILLLRHWEDYSRRKNRGIYEVKKNTLF